MQRFWELVENVPSVSSSTFIHTQGTWEPARSNVHEGTDKVRVCEIGGNM